MQSVISKYPGARKGRVTKAMMAEILEDADDEDLEDEIDLDE